MCNYSTKPQPKMSKFLRLCHEVIAKSELSNTMQEASIQWQISGFHEIIPGDQTLTCLCSHKGLKCTYSIRNVINGNEFDNIGSECIKHFGKKDMERDACLLQMGKKKFTKGKHRGKMFNELIGNKDYVRFLRECYTLSPIYKTFLEYHDLCERLCR